MLDEGLIGESTLCPCLFFRTATPHTVPLPLNQAGPLAPLGDPGVFSTGAGVDGRDPLYAGGELLKDAAEA